MATDSQKLSKNNVKPVLIEDELKESFLDYAMSVVVSRAIPDIRDGLKPVHRRVLYTMYQLGFFHNKPYHKSVRVVGEVLGKYHPHGDQAVYNTMVGMVQDFSKRYPLLDGQGNWGSVDGDNAAAMRYTEVRMAKIAQEFLLILIKKPFNLYQTLMNQPLSQSFCQANCQICWSMVLPVLPWVWQPLFLRII